MKGNRKIKKEQVSNNAFILNDTHRMETRLERRKKNCLAVKHKCKQCGILNI